MGPAADPTRLKKVRELDVPGILFCVARVPGSARLFAGSSDFEVYELDLAAESPELLALGGAGHESYVTGVALAAGHLVSGSYDGRLIWWSLEERAPVRTLDAHEKWIRNVAAAPDGRLVASVADDMQCRVWDAGSGELLRTLSDHEPFTPHNYPSMLYAVAFSPDGRYLAAGDKVGHVAVWETASGEKVGEVEAPGMYTWDPRQRIHSIGGIRSLAFAPDAALLAVGGIGQIGNIDHLDAPARIEVFDWQAGQRVHELEDPKHKGLVEQLAFHDSGQWFLAAGGDHGGYVTFWETATGNVLIDEKAPMHIHGYAFNETFDRLYAVGHGKVAEWALRGEGPVVAPAPPVD